MDFTSSLIIITQITSLSVFFFFWGDYLHIQQSIIFLTQSLQKTHFVTFKSRQNCRLRLIHFYSTNGSQIFSAPCIFYTMCQSVPSLSHAHKPPPQQIPFFKIVQFKYYAYNIPTFCICQHWSHSPSPNLFLKPWNSPLPRISYRLWAPVLDISFSLSTLYD